MPFLLVSGYGGIDQAFLGDAFIGLSWLLVLVLGPFASLAIFGSDKWGKCDFSILILAVWHLHPSIDHIKAVWNHYFTAGLDIFLPTFNVSTWIALAEIGSWVAISDFSIWVLAVWHLHPSIDHIKAVQNHYFTAGLVLFLPTFNSSKCVSHAVNRQSVRGEGDQFPPRPFLLASGYRGIDKAMSGDAFIGLS